MVVSTKALIGHAVGMRMSESSLLMTERWRGLRGPALNRVDITALPISDTNTFKCLPGRVHMIQVLLGKTLLRLTRLGQRSTQLCHLTWCPCGHT